MKYHATSVIFLHLSMFSAGELRARQCYEDAPSVAIHRDDEIVDDLINTFQAIINTFLNEKSTARSFVHSFIDNEVDHNIRARVTARVISAGYKIEWSGTPPSIIIRISW